MSLRWPWRRRASADRLALAWSGGTLAYAQARAEPDGALRLLKLGVEQQGSDTLEAFVERVAELQLHGGHVSAMLRPEQCQLLQIDAPKVAPEELRQAARYQIREMVDTHLDDLTIDVLRVGDGENKNNPLMFVVAAKNEVVREVSSLASALAWPLGVIDIQELALRNLQSALSAQAGTAERATAALVVSSERQAVITISAGAELYFSRRLELPEGFMKMDWGSAAEHFDASAPDAYTPVVEYVPEYASNPFATDPVGGKQSDRDRAQRVVVEVQRSLDLWERTWSSLPLASVQVYAAEKSRDLATWLTQELGQSVQVMEVESLFPGFGAMEPRAHLACLPLLGLLLRPPGAKG